MISRGAAEESLIPRDFTDFLCRVKSAMEIDHKCQTAKHNLPGKFSPRGFFFAPQAIGAKFSVLYNTKAELPPLN